MGTVRLGPIVTVIGMMLLGLVFVVTILTGPGNVLGATYRFLWIPALLMGCMTPRLAMYVLVVMAIYLDVPKKFLVVGDVMDFRDVYFILALPPVMLAGIVLQYVASFSLRIRVFSRRAAVLLSTAVALVAATALFSIMKYGANPVVLKALANTSAYYGMIFVVPLVLPRLVDIQKYQRFILVMMVPAAVHAILHFFYGLADFETDYMRSGFSQNYSYVLWGEGIFGPFSAQGPLSASMAMCAALCLTPFLFRSRMSKGLRLMHPAVSIVLFVLFATTAVLSLKRGPLLLIPGAFVGFFILRSRILTWELMAELEHWFSSSSFWERSWQANWKHGRQRSTSYSGRAEPNSTCSRSGPFIPGSMISVCLRTSVTGRPLGLKSLRVMGVTGHTPMFRGLSWNTGMCPF